jgi:hypothetical protein
MAIPGGKVVERRTVARACGCLCEFRLYAVDAHRAQRLAKFQQSQCRACVDKANAEKRRLAAVMPGKGEAVQALPPDTRIAISAQPKGKWAGQLSAAGTTVVAVGDSPAGLPAHLARLWVAVRRKK